MNEDLEKKKIQLLGDSLFGVNYKKQFKIRLTLTLLSGLALILFSHIILAFSTILFLGSTIESYYKYTKYQK